MKCVECNNYNEELGTCDFLFPIVACPYPADLDIEDIIEEE